ncbi:MAG: hypothetical protein AAB217_24800 [Chloroflexota bacterium]
MMAFVPGLFLERQGSSVGPFNELSFTLVQSTTLPWIISFTSPLFSKSSQFHVLRLLEEIARQNVMPAQDLAAVRHGEGRLAIQFLEKLLLKF